MRFKNLQFIINPVAGTADTILNTSSEVLSSQDVHWQVAVTHQDGDGARLAQQAAEDGADLIVAYGGDGTVKDVASGLFDMEIPLAILPGGTGNALAYKLGIPQTLRQALELLVGDFDTTEIDMGYVVCGGEQEEVEGYFLLRCNIGVQNDILENADREMKNQFGNLAYIFSTITSLQEVDSQTYNISIDGEEHELDGVACMVANAVTLGGGMAIDLAPDVKVDDGCLDAFVFEPQSQAIMDIVKSNLDADLGAFPGHYAGQTFSIETATQQTVTIDGEELGQTPVTLKVVPQAVRILVPKGGSR